MCWALTGDREALQTTTKCASGDSKGKERIK